MDSYSSPNRALYAAILFVHSLAGRFDEKIVKLPWRLKDGAAIYLYRLLPENDPTFMDELPWISLSRKDGTALRIDSRPFHSLFPNSQQSFNDAPSIITFIGKREKATILRELLGGPKSTYPQEHHGQVHVWLDPSSSREYSRLFVDFEMHNHSSSHWTLPAPSSGPGAFTRVKWETPVAHSNKELGALICTRVLAPVSNLFCLFTADFNGMRGVAETLAGYVGAHLPNDLSYLTRPRVLVVVMTASKSPNAALIEGKLHTLLKQCMRRAQPLEQDVILDDQIYGCFHSIRTLPIPQSLNRADKATLLYTHLSPMDRDARETRSSNKVLFRHAHVQSLCVAALQHLCRDGTEPLSIIKVSRPHRFDDNAFPTHLDDLLQALKSEAWLWYLAVPLISSALLLATYPPDAHRFSPSLLFPLLYKQACQTAIQKYTALPDTHSKFLRDIEADFCSLFERLESQDAKYIHFARLKELRRYLTDTKSNKDCYCCLMRSPEKVLDCGHAFCNVCIRTSGMRGNEMYTYAISECMICASAHSSRQFTFIPPTAGIRVLSIDGGGVRGIIPLTVLQRLERDFAFLGCPLRDHFDFNVGTSSGGITNIGIFIMLWSASECMEKFYRLVNETFGRRKKASLLLGRIQTILLTYLDDCRYKSIAIEAAFQSSLGPPPKLFNPLQSDTKVAVIAAPVRGKVTSVICNYNGGSRPADIGYRIMRAEDPEDDVTVGEAAICTSAAPGFFKPKLLRYFGTHQDGALHHNNPAKIAIWEQRFIWPDRGLESQPDFVLSIGTGSTIDKTGPLPHSPALDGFISRYIGAFNWNIDAERAWKEVINFTPTKFRNRYHRINLPLDTNEPDIDDTSTIDLLRSRTSSMLLSSPKYEAFKDNLVASMFFFELQQVIEQEDNYICTGHVLCRLNLLKPGRKSLYQKLMDSNSYFNVNGQPVQCVQSVPRNLPPFRRRIKFAVDDLTDNLYISLRGWTREPSLISGLPRSVEDFVEVQGLAATFGRIDHRSTSLFSLIPRKRRYS